MEKQLGKLKIAGVSFAAANKSVPLIDCRIQAAQEQALYFGQSLETPSSPVSAMEFLSRSWSPSASTFLQMFPTSDLQPAASDKNCTADCEEQFREEQSEQQRNRILAINNRRKMDLNQVKGWVKGKPVIDFFRSCKNKKKEEIRFHTANLHAALSLTKLAAAIAGFANGTRDINLKNNVETKPLYEGMGSVVATAATLMTTVCAEAAESLGADRSLVASAVNSGLTISTAIDMMAVTATAATCLRGATILKSRTEDYFPRLQETFRICSQICIITPSGNKEYKNATVYSKQKYVILCFQKKYFGGTLTTSKEYKVLSIEDTTESEGYFFLTLKTNKGTVKLLFEDEKELSIWISTISNLQKMHNTSYKLTNIGQSF